MILKHYILHLGHFILEFLFYLQIWDLNTYPRTYFGHFCNMSLFDDSRTV